MSNPYDNPQFATEYTRKQADIHGANQYEWSVTHRALLQLIHGRHILDYGCGPGIFSAGIALENKESHVVGTDVSGEILKRSAFLGENVTNLTFKHWHPEEGVDIPPHSIDTLLAKLVLNYMPAEQLTDDIFPRFRDLIRDDGTVVAVLPNPLREADYDTAANDTIAHLQTRVGGFDSLQPVDIYHHSTTTLVDAAANAGLKIVDIVGLPEVRFMPYGHYLRPSTARKMMIANPMPLIHTTFNSAKRFVYMFAKTDAAIHSAADGLAQLYAWRTATFPEIADRAHVRIPPEHINDNNLAASFTGASSRDALYDYCNDDLPPAERQHVILGRDYAEGLTARRKLRLARELAKKGIRPCNDPSLFFAM